MSTLRTLCFVDRYWCPHFVHYVLLTDLDVHTSYIMFCWPILMSTLRTLCFVDRSWCPHFVHYVLLTDLDVHISYIMFCWPILMSTLRTLCFVDRSWCPYFVHYVLLTDIDVHTSYIMFCWPILMSTLRTLCFVDRRSGQMLTLRLKSPCDRRLTGVVLWCELPKLYLTSWIYMKKHKLECRYQEVTDILGIRIFGTTNLPPPPPPPPSKSYQVSIPYAFYIGIWRCFWALVFFQPNF